MAMNQTSGGGNRHPVDRLAEVREHIRALKVEEAKFRSEILGHYKNDLIGDEYRAVIHHQSRRMLDIEKLQAELGKRLEEFYRSEPVTIVKVKHK